MKWEMTKAGRDLAKEILETYNEVVGIIPEAMARVFEENIPRRSSPVKRSHINRPRDIVERMESDYVIMGLNQRKQMVEEFMSNSAIPRKYRHIAKVCFIDGYPVEKYSRYFGISLRTVRRWQKKALDMFALYHIGPYLGGVKDAEGLREDKGQVSSGRDSIEGG
jgi:hypothetical protein